jgi:epoxide hydrolase-like predicted phosphatase
VGTGRSSLEQATVGSTVRLVLGGLIVDFGGVLTDPGDSGGDDRPLLAAVALARKHGLRTGLLSNADGLGDTGFGGDDGPGGADLGKLFDDVLLSGDVGFGKPDARIYLLAAERLGLVPEECVFVDDLAHNVLGAVRVGMVGVHHQDMATTLTELTALFGVPFQE